MAGLETAIHEFSLPFHKRKTPFSVRAFPLVKKICAVDLSSRVRARFVGAERTRNASQHRLRVAQVKRIFKARHPDEILQAARLTIVRYPIKKHSVVTGISERESRLTASVLRCENQLRIPRQRQRPGSLRPDAAQPVGAQKQAVDERRVREVPCVWVRRVQPAKVGEELSAFQLQIVREAAGLQKSFLELDLGLVVVVQ